WLVPGGARGALPARGERRAGRADPAPGARRALVPDVAAFVRRGAGRSRLGGREAGAEPHLPARLGLPGAPTTGDGDRAPHVEGPDPADRRGRGTPPSQVAAASGPGAPPGRRPALPEAPGAGLPEHARSADPRFIRAPLRA